MNDNPSQLHRQAINAALSSSWDEAISINEHIIEVDPRNIDALNRLARAHFELGHIKQAREYYELALKYDPYNQIAFKFLKRIEACKKKDLEMAIKNAKTIPPPSQLTPDLFIEEPGKTKLVNLLKVAEPQKLSLLSSGEAVNLVTKTRYISVTDQSGKYLGILPDDLSRRLIRLIKGGNKYHALIKTAKPNGLSIIIRETYRCPRFKNQPSFLDNLNMTLAYSSDHIIISDGHEDSVEDEGEEDSNS